MSGPPDAPPPALRWRLWTVVAIGSTATVGGLVLWWLFALAGDDPDLRMNAVRNGFAVTLGLGGAWTALLVARRQWHQERQHLLAEKTQLHRELDADRAHERAERHAREAQEDARQRRITDLYVKAVEQLGHGAAAVRLGGLYALDRLGRRQPEYRPVVVDVWCSYLRMPLPDREDDAAGADEVQVRITAQRLLKARLRDPRPVAERNATQPEASEEFWPHMRVDLTAAVLHEPNFGGCHLGDAWFTGARMVGTGLFDEAVFHGDAVFTGVRCDNGLDLDRAIFTGAASFASMVAAGHVSMTRTVFEGPVSLRDARCVGDFSVIDCLFTGGADLSGVHLGGTAMVVGAVFHGLPRVDDDMPMTGTLPITGRVTVVDDLDDSGEPKPWRLTFTRTGLSVTLPREPTPDSPS
ncbi:MAG TPA: pentapeptide repeat-containing protein [Phytomonospora sp.]